MKKSLVVTLATLGPVGSLPAGGTMGSLAALLLYIPIAMFLNFQQQLAIVIAFTIMGIAICHYAAIKLKSKDPSKVVWDELCGMWIALLAAPFSPVYWLLTFALFRLFDITKVSIIGWCDKKLKGGLGIMADDILAGLFALAAVKALWWSTALIPW